MGVTFPETPEHVVEPGLHVAELPELYPAVHLRLPPPSHQNQK